MKSDIYASLKGRTALVTGGGSGIGAALSQRSENWERASSAHPGPRLTLMKPLSRLPMGPDGPWLWGLHHLIKGIL